MSEQKDFHSGGAQCKPTQWNAWRLVRGFRKTTCNWATQLVRLHKALPNSQPMPNSMISSLLARLYRRILKSPPQTTMLECHAKLFLTETPCQLLEKPTLTRIMLNWLTKILWILDWRWAYLIVLTEGELCLDHTITCLWQTDALFTGHIKFSFNLFIRVRIKKLSAELGRGLLKDYIAVS